MWWDPWCVMSVRGVGHPLLPVWQWRFLRLFLWPLYFTEANGGARELLADAQVAFTLTPAAGSPGPSTGSMLVTLSATASSWLQAPAITRTAGAWGPIPFRKACMPLFMADLCAGKRSGLMQRHLDQW